MYLAAHYLKEWMNFIFDFGRWHYKCHLGKVLKTDEEDKLIFKTYLWLTCIHTACAALLRTTEDQFHKLKAFLWYNKGKIPCLG